MLKEIVRWSSTGQSEAEQEAMKHVTLSSVGKVKGSVINTIIAMRNQYPYGDKIQFSAHPKRDYYLYSNYHCNSGYKTTFDKIDDQVIATIHEPDGFTLQAFFSEVVIMEETGQLVTFK
jgi:hypothetical protein